MTVICGLIFAGIVLTIVGYGIAVTVALLTDDLIESDIEHNQEA